MKKSRIYALCLSTFLVGVIVSALVSTFLVGRMAQAAGPTTGSGNPHTNQTILCPRCNIGTDPGEHGLLGSYDFRNAYMPNCGLGGNLDGFDFSGADLFECSLGRLTARHARFVGTYLARSGGNLIDLSYSDFSHANLSNIVPTNSNFTGANFTSADLSGTKGSIIDWRTTNFTDANFTNANLSGVQLQVGMPGMVFTGAIWSNTTCPDGTNSDADGHTCVGHFLFIS